VKNWFRAGEGTGGEVRLKLYKFYGIGTSMVFLYLHWLFVPCWIHFEFQLHSLGHNILSGGATVRKESKFWELVFTFKSIITGLDTTCS